ncbi:spermidine synthase [Melittangium boletus]|uniref:spermidine synthase n=1 Tax=Melittangium boletus TaxID=83453 RepID=UPI003DA1EF30
MLPYAATLFLSAFLLFGVQPLAGKYSLPWFGGTSTVWTTCMLFFQAMLLGGYAYSYVSTRWLTPRKQARVHLGLLGITAAVLLGRVLVEGSPVAPGPEWRPAADGISTWRLLAMLAATLGLPFFTLSTSAPLLQSWFSRAKPGVSPYRLYALSNTGSLLALLAYPLLAEPWLSRGVQAWAWGLGFLVFAVGSAVCARNMMKLEEPAAAAVVQETPAEAEGADEAPGVPRTLGWLGLSTLASVLLTATTNQMSQDVSAGPFVWVLPLALYLITFIIAFEREALYSRTGTALLLLGSVYGVARITYEGPHVPLPIQVLVYCLTLFSGALLCNGELYRLRPAPRHLGAFYLWGSVGGFLGTAIVNLVAPNVLRTYLEFPLSLSACCLLAAMLLLRRADDESIPRAAVRFAPALGLLLVSVGVHLADADTRRPLDSWRGFFGVVQVGQNKSPGNENHAFLLRHGVIIHGVQYTQNGRRLKPTAYYTPDSGLGLAIQEQRRLREVAGKAPGLNIGVLGLGIGTTAALGRPEDTLRFYEINPQVIELAEGKGDYFTFLKDTKARYSIHEGDARILLEQELAKGQGQGFDVLAVDVFSSDSIPVHLLTEEAVALYRQHLAPGGVIALHISNVHLDLLPIPLAHAHNLGLHLTRVHTKGNDEAESEDNTWVLLAPDKDFSRGETFLAESDERVKRLAYDITPPVRWTDDLSSLLPVIRTTDEPDRSGIRVEPSGKPESAPVAAPAVP